MGFTTTASKRLILATAIAGLFGASAAPAFADMETLLDKLHEKGVLNDDDYQQMRTEARADRRTQALKDAQDQEQKQTQHPSAADTGKFKVADAIKSMELFGDLRLRYEDRIATSPTNTNYDRQRWRYALRVGVRGDVADDFFYGLRLDTGTYGRSAWVTFADDNAAQGGKSAQANKTNDAVNVGLAYLGWKPTNWLQVIGGRQPNPLYTTPMVWDPDIAPEGLVEKATFKPTDNLNTFLTAGQFIYQDFSKPSSNNSSLSTGRQDLMLYAFEAGANYKLGAESALKGAINYYTYAGGQGVADFRSTFTGSGTGYAGNIGVNDLEVIEIPLEFRFPIASYSGLVYANLAKNLKGSDRATRAGFSNYGGQDKAYQVGFSLASQGIPQGAGTGAVFGNSAKKGTWETRVYWQRIEQFALDPNMIDSDFFERTNLEGWFLAAAYSPADAIITTVRYGQAKRYNDSLGTGGFNDDSSGLASSINKYKLAQFDVTLRF